MVRVFYDENDLKIEIICKEKEDFKELLHHLINRDEDNIP